ncbi:MAG: sigma 54-interacting transcriptional regulator [Thermoanaerobaculia bacterium]|nr:sigma 54-interacting transcriptional regulator [Thermoanaerobaculia bacterium]
MTLVLVAHEEDRVLRFPLSPGEYIVGSSTTSDLRIGHPTISRRHASIKVGNSPAPPGSAELTLEIEDLGSRNGTRVRGQKLERVASLEPGDEILFGSVAVTLESVADGDMEAGISFSATRSDPPSTPDEPQRTTASVGSIRAFALEKLPGLLARLEEGAEHTSMAQAVGEALASTLPCLRLEIARRAGDRQENGILFLAEYGHLSEQPSEAEVVHGEIEVRVVFPHPSQASGYRPLIVTATRLIGLALPAPRRKPAVEQEAPRLPDPPTVDPVVRRIYQDAARVAQGDVGVLISGESGTGKEILAGYLHAASPRRERPFVALNCAALASDLLESELFGIERGVATGVDSRPGRFEQADQGTLFLDEIGDMAPETQAKILRVLQEGEVYRIGGREPRPARVRVLAATNRDMESLLEAGSFRLDLYHRIADWRVELPPLRRRPGDIPNLAAHFLERSAARRSLYVAGISRAAIDALLAHHWPGNVRELEREMARAILFLQEGELLRTDHLALGASTELDVPKDGSLKETLRSAERRALRQALEACDGNMTAAAKRLAIGRTTLYRRLKELELLDAS